MVTDIQNDGHWTHTWGLKPQGQSGGSLLVLALDFCGVHDKAGGSMRSFEVQVGLHEVV